MDRFTDPRVLADVLASEAEETRARQLSVRQAALVAVAEAEMESIASAVLGERFGSLERALTKGESPPREYLALRAAQVEPAALWLDAIPMPTGTIATTSTNTTSNQYIVQVSDRLPQELLRRVLAHEVGELAAVHERSSQGLTPVRENLLEQGTEFGEHPELSSRDHGRIGELNWLASRAVDANLAEQSRSEARFEFSAYLDQCGLRPMAAVSDIETYAPEERAARVRRFASKDFLSLESERLVRELALPIEQLDPADASALQASREAAVVAQRQVEAFIGRRDITMPMPGYDQNGVPLPREQVGPASVQWADYRGQMGELAAQTVENQNAAGEIPLRKVTIGGGASLSGRDDEALLIDAVGRWHLDPGKGIVQSADQDRDLAQWMGVDPYQAVDEPGDRISIDAVRLWEDQLATQGDVVNGRAHLRLDENGTLLAEAQAFNRDGSERGGAPLLVRVDGTPNVATGLTPEVVPGIARDNGELGPGVESRSEAVRLISERLQELEGQNVAGASELRGQLTDAERTGADAATVLAAVNSSNLRGALVDGLGDGPVKRRLQGCFTTLDATEKWETAREAAPGRVLMGDEVAENRFNPADAEHWIVAGSGGTGVANAEIILRENPNAKVTIIGAAPPPALEHQVQFPEMREEFKGRLNFVTARVGAIETFQGEDGRTSFRLEYPGENEGDPKRVLEGDGYVASLGRTNPLPPALQTLANQVRDNRGQVTGDLMFDQDDQYIGYGLTFRTEDGKEHRVDVDGAASWQLPREVFTPESGIQQRLNAMGARALPAETGNASPGFSPIARQSALRARAVAAEQAGDENAVQRIQDIPLRWRPPELSAPTKDADGPSNSPSPATPTQQQEATTEQGVTPQRQETVKEGAVPQQPQQTARQGTAQEGAAPPPQPKPTAAVPQQRPPTPPAPTQAPAPAPTPAPQPPRPGQQFLPGVQVTGRRSATAPTQPQQAPPDQQRPGPNRGPGMGD
ncbi:hypothetical protein ACF09C_23770 [Streptomyces sp. NPDC014870]|uniref:hypothetical protein n=1 Tax=Streptomyces sp. NPDC014870 TaxID=3364925 RepID=UPI0037020F79